MGEVVVTVVVEEPGGRSGLVVLGAWSLDYLVVVESA